MKKVIFLILICVFSASFALAAQPATGVTVFNGASSYNGIEAVGGPMPTVINSVSQNNYAEQGVVLGGNYLPVGVEVNQNGSTVGARTGNSRSAVFAEESNFYGFKGTVGTNGVNIYLDAGSNGYVETQHRAAGFTEGYNYTGVFAPGVSITTQTGGGAESIGNANSHFNSGVSVNVSY